MKIVLEAKTELNFFQFKTITNPNIMKFLPVKNYNKPKSLVFNFECVVGKLWLTNVLYNW
jgi:hypothetical protein